MSPRNVRITSDVWQLEQVMVPFTGLMASAMLEAVEFKRAVERLRGLIEHAPSLERVMRMLDAA
ncbi:MAG TPA: hypothetical protein VF331_00330 [Polyangiales bacterium]